MPEPSAARCVPQAPAREWLRALPPAARFILQCGPAARAAASTVFGVALSGSACRANSQGSRAALWLGPDEHLLLGPAGDAEALSAALEAAMANVAHALVEISHRQVALQVSGPHASAILNTGCPLNLELTAFPVGMCTRTMLGKAEIVLWRTGAAEFHLEVWRSFSDYVSRWLLEASQDFAEPGTLPL